MSSIVASDRQSGASTPVSVPSSRFAGVIDRLLTAADVQAVVGLGHATIYRRIAAGTFPRPRRLSPGCVRWRLSAINAWLEALPEAVDETPESERR